MCGLAGELRFDGEPTWPRSNGPAPTWRVAGRTATGYGPTARWPSATAACRSSI